MTHTDTGLARPTVFEPLEGRVFRALALIEAIDGTGNNLLHAAWGSAGTDLLRLSTAAYAGGVSSPTGADRPSARAVSNAVSAQSADLENTSTSSASFSTTTST